jgi:hypothetical protein
MADDDNCSTEEDVDREYFKFRKGDFWPLTGFYDYALRMSMEEIVLEHPSPQVLARGTLLGAYNLTFLYGPPIVAAVGTAIAMHYLMN